MWNTAHVKAVSLQEELTIEVFKMLLTLVGVHSNGQPIRAHGSVQSWVLVHVLHEQSGADCRSIVDTRASISMTAGTVRGERSGSLCSN